MESTPLRVGEHTEGALAATWCVKAGWRLAENQVHWFLGRNLFGVPLMEGVGAQFAPYYHHRYNSIPGNPRSAVPDALLNGIIRSWPHQDRPGPCPAKIISRGCQWD